MTYISDNPWPLILLLVATSVAAFLLGESRGKAAAVTCLLVAVGLYFLEQYLASPREEVEQQLQTMLTHFKNRDVAAIEGQISADSPNLAIIAAQGLELVDVEETFHLRSVDCELKNNELVAEAFVRANGDVTLRSRGGGSRHIPTFWKTIWKREDSSWKLVEVVRLNPANGEEMGYFSGQ